MLDRVDAHNEGVSNGGTETCYMGVVVKLSFLFQLRTPYSDMAPLIGSPPFTSKQDGLSERIPQH
jgi:hypothetical protein